MVNGYGADKILNFQAMKEKTDEKKILAAAMDVAKAVERRGLNVSETMAVGQQLMVSCIGGLCPPATARQREALHRFAAAAAQQLLTAMLHRIDHEPREMVES